jgi:hypothetical protein
MGMSWGEKPVFPNAPKDSERALWSRRCVINTFAASLGTIAITWSMDFWTSLAIIAVLILAFDAGDHRALYGDGPEPEKFEDGTYVTPHDRFYPER